MNISLFPPHFRCSTACYKRQSRLLHLVTAPVCLWQHVLRKSRLGQDHLPRVMPPALRPFEAHISRRMQALVQSVSSTPMSSTSINLVSKLTWNQLFVVLNACLLTKLQPLWSYNSTNMDSKSSFTSSVTNEKDSNYFVCSLVYTLIDTIGFRLADILTPEVRIHAITSLVSLSKMWTSWNASFLDNKESKNIRDGTNGEIPLELPYL
ncbi:unnamed protein product [Trichobilharzia regenti]|nr:unnamed protein product [Trichobilharzia regenti]